MDNQVINYSLQNSSFSNCRAASNSTIYVKTSAAAFSHIAITMEFQNEHKERIHTNITIVFWGHAIEQSVDFLVITFENRITPFYNRPNYTKV